jgi:NADPH:quinone reductase-like Zn-dependent oxidoreductase
VAKAVLVAKLPGNIPFSEACVLPVAFNTALVSLCAPPGQGFGLQLPSLNPNPSGKTIVVWGASSSCGTLILQLARAAGIKAIAVASEHNHELCRSCGAVDTLDYRKDSIVSDVVKAVKSVEGEFVGIIDCVSIEDQSLKFCIPVLEQLGGGKLGNLLPHARPEVPDNVELTNIFGMNDITHAFWKDYLTPALKQGKLTCTPEPLVVGDGLGSFQKALDVQRKGVSAKKVVVTL